ncbi:MAG TPA: AsmA family protein [Caldimonas sp.]
MADVAAAAAPKRRWGRIVAILLGVLALLVAATWVALTLTFPPERLAALLVSQVKAATGRDFRIDGELSIRILPTIAAQAGDVVLGNADWGSRPEMLRVRSASFELSPKALLAGELRILRVEVAGVDALLETDGAGHANWQFGSRTPAAPEPASSPDKGRAPRLELEHVVASDVRVSYRPGRSSKAHTLAIESFDLRPQGERDRIVMALALGPQHWKIEGLVGRSTLFLAGEEDWPFELKLATEGATLAATGTLGTGPRTGAVAADVSAKVATAAALVPLGAAAAALPLPLELRTTLRWGDDKLRADPLRLVLAGQAIEGRASLSDLQARPRLEAELAAKAIDVGKLRSGASAASKPSPAAAKGGGPLFGDTPLLPFDAVLPIEMKIGLAIKQLNLPDLPPLSALKARLTSTPDRLTLEELQFNIAGGRVRGRMAIAPAATPRVELSLDARSLSLEALDGASGAKRVRGGRTDLVANLSSTGRTPRSLAAGANGNVMVSVTEATLGGGAAAALDRNVIASVLRLVLPKGSTDRPLVVQCAVARLPLRQGIAPVDRSIALETREVAIVASGNINLVDQTLRLEFEPTVKKGLGLNSANFAELVRVSGPLQDPQARVDVKGAVRGAANVGVAVATGGLSLLAPIALGGTKDVPPCGHATAAKPATGDKKHHFPGAR